MPSLPNIRPTRMVRCCTAFLPVVLALTAAGQQNCQTTKHAAHGAAKGGGLALWPWDILHQRITLDLTQGNLISGACAITAAPRDAGPSALPLQLLDLTVDSVVMAGALLPFTHIGIDLIVQLPQAYTPADTIDFTVHYSGDPVLDPSGFGGFYTTGAYLYNLGVAFTSVPHSYGRAWFPCADNFTERSSYEFIVTTTAPYTAWCNGELLSETQPSATTVTRHWRLDESIPSYLASVSAANYAVVRDTLTSITSEEIPVTLVARAPDTTAMKNSFINLQGAFDRFEQWFGPYRWNRVGYVLTPQGAMEHATSIHYPQSIANGSLSYQDVMAHELAHHWFGNLVTCERAEEMYLNEGFAEYLAYLFIEEVNGASAYMNTVRLNHRRMLQRAHLDDGGWWALSEMPQEWTYGEHTYNKGADVLHTLRSYMGDSLFRVGLTSFLDAFEFEHVNTEMLRDHLNQVTGLDLTDYFTDWIQQPGWAAFEVEAFDWTDLGNGTSTVNVTVQQKHRGPADHYHNVPMSVSFVQPDGALWTLPEPVLLGGELTTFSATVPFIPHGVFLNADERISQAVTFDMEAFSGPATRQYTNSDMRLTVNSTPAPFTIRVEEYWVAADDEVDEAFAYVVSPDRYWRITATDLPSDASLSGRFNYDGRPAPAIAFDSGLMQDFGGLPFREDSLVMLYREGPDWPWVLHPNQTLTALGSLTDRQGRIDINDLRPGEYCFAWRKSAVGIGEIGAESIAWTLMPNPAEDFVIARADRPVQGVIELLDSRGRLVRWEPINGEQARIEVQGVKRGAYHLRFVSTLDTREKAGKLLIE
ncbi:MAG: hypothetical protein IPK70_03790 [Flavobacteriales bacterium]|nr:hypothetical protein [Flavobacteriales bacterium]